MITIDFETVDPYIGLGYGPGWVFSLLGYDNPKFSLLGASIKIDDGDTKYYTDLKQIARIIKSQNELCMHNCMYDIGCILVLFNQLAEEWDYNQTLFYDTMLMTKLVDQHQLSYSLENCSKRYGGAIKSKDTLTNYVWDSGLYQKWYKDFYGRNKHTRPDENKLFKYAIENLNKLPQEIVAEYCDFDVNATYDLFLVLKDKLDKFPDNFDLSMFSTLIKACVNIKHRGVRVDIDQARKTSEYLNNKIRELTIEVYREVGYEFNINAPKQLIDALKSIGIAGFAKTEKGNDSANKEWLKDQGHDICRKIVKIKNYDKLVRDFLRKLIDYQQIHRQNNSQINRVFPNFNILGATKTGRMSSSGYRKDGYELNFQQIPKRGDDKEASEYVRAVFLPDEGEQWISADYSNQEQRLQVEFAHQLGLKSVEPVFTRLLNEPNADFHSIVSEICEVNRTDAKTVNLGLSYSMGQAKLCRSLGLPTKKVFSNRWQTHIEVAGKEGKEILDKYHKFLPFMKQLQHEAMETIKKYGYIKTIDGRKLYNDPPMKYNGKWKSWEYKALSKLVQGSGAGVMYKALVNSYNRGLKLLLPIHDEINISSKNYESDIETLKNCMEHTYDISVPMVVDISKGNTWAG